MPRAIPGTSGHRIGCGLLLWIPSDMGTHSKLVLGLSCNVCGGLKLIHGWVGHGRARAQGESD